MENRLNLLCEAGVIDKDICSGMLQVVRRLDEEWRLPIHSEQGTMAMTHMASALMRSRQGEVIEALDGELLEELAQAGKPAVACLLGMPDAEEPVRVRGTLEGGARAAAKLLGLSLPIADPPVTAVKQPMGKATSRPCRLLRLTPASRSQPSGLRGVRSGAGWTPNR